MNERETERRLRGWLDAQASPAVPDELRRAVASIPATVPIGSLDRLAGALGWRPAAVPRPVWLLLAAALLLALVTTATFVGSRLATVTEPLPQGRFDAVFVRSPADGDATAASTIWAVGADGTERLLASVPGLSTDGAMSQWMSMSEAGHLALLMRNGDRVGWAILDVTDPGAKPIPVVLPGRADTDRGWALWGPGERLAIWLSPQTVDQEAVAFVDPTTGAATVLPVSDQYGCFGDRCGVWAADGSGVVMYAIGPPSGLVILGPDGHIAPFQSRIWPNNIGDRDVNEAGDLLLGGINPLDNPPFDNELLYVRAPGEDDRLVLRLAGELPDRAWAADGRDAWLLSAQWLEASRPVTLERFRPPSTRTAIASFVAAVDVPAKDTYAPAASFAGIAPDDSLAVVSIPTTSSEPVVFQGKLVDLRSGVSTDVDGSFVGWLATQEQPEP